MSKQIMQQAFENMQKNERHTSYGETQYWCNQYKMFAVRLLTELAKPEQPQTENILYLLSAWQRGAYADEYPTEIAALRQALAQPEPAIGDIRALKHRIHELEGELIGYKRLLDAQPEQEPVAYMHTCGSDIQINTLPAHCYGNNWTRTPLYTAPPSKPWQSLTDEEVHEAAIKCVKSGQSVNAAIRAIEAALRSKNT